VIAEVDTHNGYHEQRDQRHGKYDPNEQSIVVRSIGFLTLHFEREPAVVCRRDVHVFGWANMTSTKQSTAVIVFHVGC
jgi:hypothetical protein